MTQKGSTRAPFSEHTNSWTNANVLCKSFGRVLRQSRKFSRCVIALKPSPNNKLRDKNPFAVVNLWNYKKSPKKEPVAAPFPRLLPLPSILLLLHFPRGCVRPLQRPRFCHWSRLVINSFLLLLLPTPTDTTHHTATPTGTHIYIYIVCWQSVDERSKLEWPQSTDQPQ